MIKKFTKKKAKKNEVNQPDTSTAGAIAPASSALCPAPCPTAHKTFKDALQAFGITAPAPQRKIYKEPPGKKKIKQNIQPQAMPW